LFEELFMKINNELHDETSVRVGSERITKERINFGSRRVGSQYDHGASRRITKKIIDFGSGHDMIGSSRVVSVQLSEYSVRIKAILNAFSFISSIKVYGEAW